jgi:hypothetical protein
MTSSTNTRRRFTAIATLILPLDYVTGSIAETTHTGRLDFLKSKDSSFALFANTSATFEPGKVYPNEVVLITPAPIQPRDLGTDRHRSR